MDNDTWTVEQGYRKATKWVDDLDIPWVDVQTGDMRDDISFGNLAQADTQEIEEYLSRSGAWLAFTELNIASLTSKKGAYETALDMEMKVAKSQIAHDWVDLGYTKKPTIDEIEGIILSSNERVVEVMRTLTEITVAYDKLQGRREAFKGLFNTASRVLSARSMEAARNG